MKESEGNVGQNNFIFSLSLSLWMLFMRFLRCCVSACRKFKFFLVSIKYLGFFSCLTSTWTGILQKMWPIYAAWVTLRLIISIKKICFQFTHHRFHSTNLRWTLCLLVGSINQSPVYVLHITLQNWYLGAVVVIYGFENLFAHCFWSWMAFMLVVRSQKAD